MRTGPTRLTAPSARCDEPVARAHERDLVQRRVVELVPDADERPSHLRRLAEHVEQRGPLLHELEQAAVRLQLLSAHLAEQVGGAADVEPLLRGEQLREGGPERREEAALLDAQARVLEAPAQKRRPELEPGNRLVQVLGSPLREPGIDRRVEVEEPLRDPAGRGDHDHHHELRLEQQHLDVADVRRFERRSGHEREQPCHLREHLRRRLQRRLDLGARRGEVERERRRMRVEPTEQLVGVEAVAGLRRHPPGRGVRVHEQADRLELRQLGAHRGRRRVDLRALDERLRPDRLAGRDVLLDDAPQDLLLTLRELNHRRHLQAILPVTAASVPASRALRRLATRP